MSSRRYTPTMRDSILSQACKMEMLEYRWLMATQLLISDSTSPFGDLSITAPDTNVGDSSQGSAYFDLQNTGFTYLHITNLRLVNDADNAFDGYIFLNSNNQTVTSFTIAPLSTQRLFINFSPNSAGDHTAQVKFNADDPSQSSFTLNLDGKGIGPDLQVSPTSITFPDTKVGKTSASQTFTLTNNGTSVLHVTNLAVTGAVFTVNAKDSNGNAINGSSFDIAAGSNAKLSVTFAPTAIQAFNGTVKFDTNETGLAHVSMNVSGNGISAITPKPTISVTDDSGNVTDKILTFLDTQVNSSSDPLHFTISNTGVQTLTYSIGNKQGAAATDYTIAASATTVAPGDSATITVTFSPTTTGARNGTFVLTTNDTDNPSVTLSIKGNGLPSGPLLRVTDSVSPSTDKKLTLPSVHVGATSGAGTFTLKNIGNADLNVTNFALGGTNADQFSVTDGQGNPVSDHFTIGAGATFTLKVTYSPNTQTAATGNITFTTNDAVASAQNVTLQLAATPLPDAPNPPSKVTVEGVSGSALKVSWTSNSTTTAGYKIYIADAANGPYTLWKTAPKSPNYTYLKSLEAFHHYYVRVVAFNAGGEAAPASGDGSTLIPVETHSNNTPRTASNLGTLRYGKVIHGFISDNDPIDYFQVKVDTTCDFTVRLDNLNGSASVEIYRPKTKSSYKLMDKGNSDTPTATARLTPGYYLIKVLQGDSGVTSAYDMAVLPDFAGNSFLKARNLGTIGANALNVVDSVGIADTDDYYKFTMAKDGVIQATASGFNHDLDIALYDANGKKITASQNDGLTREMLSKFVKAGVYYIRVFPFKPDGDTNYKLTLLAL